MFLVSSLSLRQQKFSFVIIILIMGWLTTLRHEGSENLHENLPRLFPSFSYDIVNKNEPHDET